MDKVKFGAQTLFSPSVHMNLRAPPLITDRSSRCLYQTAFAIVMKGFTQTIPVQPLHDLCLSSTAFHLGPHLKPEKEKTVDIILFQSENLLFAQSRHSLLKQGRTCQFENGTVEFKPWLSYGIFWIYTFTTVRVFCTVMKHHDQRWLEKKGFISPYKCSVPTSLPNLVMAVTQVRNWSRGHGE